MATHEDIGLAAARTLPSHNRRYTAATTATTSTAIALSAVVGADAAAIGSRQMISVQFSTKTHWFFLNAADQDTASADDPYTEAGEISEGFIPADSTHLVYYATSAGRVNIWESSK